MPNAITMLKSDHATLKRLLRELSETTERSTRQRETLVAAIEREVNMHSQIEEEVFYPAFRTVTRGTDTEDLFFEAAEEHHLVDMVLPALKSANPKSHEFSARAKVLKDLIEHHIREEEGQMFQQARSLFSDDQLRELGDLMQVRKELPAKVKTAKATAIAKAMAGQEEVR